MDPRSMRLGLVCAALLLSLAARAEAQAEPLGRLNWGGWTADALRAHLATSPSDDLSRQTNRVLQVAEQRLGTPIAAVPHLSLEGHLSSEPAYRASAAATDQLETVYAWAMCARVADPPLADRCLSAASDAIAAWT